MPIPDVTFTLDDIIALPSGEQVALRHLTHADLLELAHDAGTPDRFIYGAAQLIKVLSPGQKVDELTADEFNDAYWKSVEPHRYRGSTVPADLEPLIAILPAPAVSERINDWPEDEQDFYRSGYSKEPGDGGWHDYTERHDILTRMRREKLAERIVTSDWFTAIAPEASARLAHNAQVEFAPESDALRAALRAFHRHLATERAETPNIIYLPREELIGRAEQLLRRLVLPDTPVPHIFTGQYGISFTWGQSGRNTIQVGLRDDRYGKYWGYYAANAAGRDEDRGEGEPPYLRLRDLLRRVLARP